MAQFIWLNDGLMNLFLCVHIFLSKSQLIMDEKYVLQLINSYRAYIANKNKRMCVAAGPQASS